jgi:hypothetical protein
MLFHTIGGALLRISKGDKRGRERNTPFEKRKGGLRMT